MAHLGVLAAYWRCQYAMLADGTGMPSSRGSHKRMAICCQSSCKWLLHVRRFATAYFTFLAFQGSQMLSKKQPWQWPLTFEKNPWHLTKTSIAKKNAFEAVGFQPLADSGALVQSRFQIKNQRENIWRTTFPENHSILKDFELAWHRVQVPRCKAMVVFLCVSSIWEGTFHNTRWNQKKARTGP